MSHILIGFVMTKLVSTSQLKMLKIFLYELSNLKLIRGYGYSNFVALLKTVILSFKTGLRLSRS